MSDTFESNSQTLDGPAWHSDDVTPDDDTDLAFTTRALYIGVSGNVKVDMAGTGTAQVFANCPVGVLPIRAKRVYDTDTTATNIVALW